MYLFTIPSCIDLLTSWWVWHQLWESGKKKSEQKSNRQDIPIGQDFYRMRRQIEGQTRSSDCQSVGFPMRASPGIIWGRGWKLFLWFFVTFFPCHLACNYARCEKIFFIVRVCHETIENRIILLVLVVFMIWARASILRQLSADIGNSLEQFLKHQFCSIQ